MKIQDLLRKDVMLLDLQATEKTAVIDEMIKNGSLSTVVG
ncbi:PTS system fructose specific transporter subunit IIABC [Streptococcus pneumoniae]|nr:PTS system fructose specific transporter subunit IIABC [Streptococcus pneumoniae]